MGQVEKFLIATQFLTRLPIPERLQSQWTMADLRGSVHLFPLVGVLVGLAAGLVYAAAVFLNLPPVIAAILAVAAQILVTGALHEDGLADVCDGFGGGRTRGEKLAIMRDSRLGTYGALGLMLGLALRIGAIAHLTDPTIVAQALVAAAALSRAAMPVALRLLPQARADGLAASAGQPERGRVLLGVGLGLAVSVACLEPLTAGAAIAASMVLAWLFLHLSRRQIGGITGDVLGGLQQCVEVSSLAFMIR
jgi:adenosylcobinamide-GDP ribazoletransferase